MLTSGFSMCCLIFLLSCIPGSLKCPGDITKCEVILLGSDGSFAPALTRETLDETFTEWRTYEQKRIEATKDNTEPFISTIS